MRHGLGMRHQCDMLIVANLLLPLLMLSFVVYLRALRPITRCEIGGIGDRTYSSVEKIVMKA